MPRAINDWSCKSTGNLTPRPDLGTVEVEDPRHEGQQGTDAAE